MNLSDVLRPSSAHRWLKCTGSVELTLKLTPDYLASLTNPAAKEGQRLHQVAADVLTNKTTLETVSDDDKVLVQPYVEYIQRMEYNLNKLAKDSNYWIEALLSHLTYKIKGTPDFISAYRTRADVRYVTVVDLKTGRIPVAVIDNAQLKLYALLFINNLPPRQIPDYVNFAVIQPKCEGITEAQITYQSLKEWEQDTVIPVLEQVENKNYTYNLGDHCRYCPARAICPEQEKQFRTVQSQTKEMINATNLDYLFWVAEKEKEVTDYIKTVKDFLIYGLTNNTIRSSTYALTPKFGHEKWKGTTEEVAEWLTHWGVTPFEQKLISPAKAKKELKKNAKLYKLENEEVQNEISKSQTERPCIGYKIENSQKLVNKVFTKIE